MTAPDIPSRRTLSSTSFIRALAKSLTSDLDDAQGVEPEAWVAVLRRRPPA